jgi:hypothetical protein
LALRARELAAISASLANNGFFVSVLPSGLPRH